jgi:hypothetical protein
MAMSTDQQQDEPQIQTGHHGPTTTPRSGVGVLADGHPSRITESATYSTSSRNGNDAPDATLSWCLSPHSNTTNDGNTAAPRSREA